LFWCQHGPRRAQDGTARLIHHAADSPGRARAGSQSARRGRQGPQSRVQRAEFGRFKLGAMCVGGAALAIGEAARYATSRKQFGKPIAAFGAIKQKLGQMTARTYAVESLLYRTAGLIDAAIAENTAADSVLAAMEEFAIEASIAKVAGSE